jgi:hypothetical protein
VIELRSRRKAGVGNVLSKFLTSRGQTNAQLAKVTRLNMLA